MIKTIVYSTDSNYVKLTCVSIYSLLKHNRIESLEIIVFSNDLNEVDKLLIKNTVEIFGSPLQIIELGRRLELIALEKKLPPLSGSFSQYLKLLLGYLLPDIEKVIYLDSDTLILKSINDLIHFDLGNNLIAGVIDIGVNKSSALFEDSDILEVDNYINTGVLIIDLNLWRIKNADLKVEYILKKFEGRSWRNQDQSIINLALQKDVKTISFEYNFYSHFHVFPYNFLNKHFLIDKHIDYKSFLIYKNSPSILHFTAPFYFRPWYKNNISPYKNLYFSYVDKINLNEILNVDDPKNYKFIYKIYDKFNYLVLKYKLFTLHFIFQGIVSGSLKQFMLKIFGVR